MGKRPLLFEAGKKKPRLTTEQKRAARRVRELSRIYFRQYPYGLPHNGIGVKYAKYMCRTMAFLPDDQRKQWLDRHAAWMDASARDYLMSLGPYWYAARSLGDHLEMDDEDREYCQAWSIVAIDVTEEKRLDINLEKNRKAQEKRRRKSGAKSQSQSLSRTKPWEAEEISRRTWERRRKAGVASSSPPSLLISTNDEVATGTQAVQAHTPSVSAEKVIRLSDYKPRPIKSLAISSAIYPRYGVVPTEHRLSL
jgi:hypothetical protein